MTKFDIIGAFLYLTYLFIPGYICCYFLRIKRYRFLYSYSISFILLIVTQLPHRYLGGLVTNWLWTLHIAICALILFTITRSYFEASSQSKIYRQTSPVQNVTYQHNYTKFVFLVVMLIIATYHILVGPYTEIPSDYWEHLARATEAKVPIAENQFNLADSFNITALFRSDTLHFLHALVAHFLGVSPIVTTTGATLVGSLVFLGSIYWFGLRLTTGIFSEDSVRITAATLAVLITTFSLGTTTFSYVRYYSYFPTVFCFPLVFLGVAVMIDYLENRHFSIKYLSIIPMSLIAISVVHLQEALFLLVLLFGVIIWRTLRTFLPNNTIPTALYTRHRIVSSLLLFGLLTASITVVTMGHESGWLGNPHVTSIPSYIPIVGDRPIANPSFRFWDTLGYFGIFVYLIYLSNLNKFRNSDFINFGMFSPLLTHFNPGYVFLFLHVGSASVLWRTSYLVPLAFTSAIILTSVSRQYIFFKKPIYSIFVIIFLAIGIITLSPISDKSKFNRLSRLPSLLEVHSSAGAQLWNDLIVHVNNLHKNNAVDGILTDNITKFVLDSAVFGKIPERGNLNYFPANNLLYKTDIKNSDFTNYLLIINKRNGFTTNSALHSGHWPHDSLEIASRYPADIGSFIKDHPSHFLLTWQHNNISVYNIRSFHDIRNNN